MPGNRTTEHSFRVRHLAGLARTTRQIVIMLMAALVVSACGTRFIYERVDWFIVWKLGSYVKLSDEQKKTTKQDISDQLEYIRKNEFPRISAFIQQAIDDSEGTVTPAMFDEGYDQIILIYEDFMTGIVPLSVRFLRSLDDEQIDELFENLEETNQEMYDEYSVRTPEERAENRNKSAVESIENFTGKLNDEQRQLIYDSLATMNDASEEWIDYQRLWQRKFRELIEERPPEDEYTERLTQLFVYPRDLHSEEYQTRVDANRQIFNQMMTDLTNSLDDKQREKLQRKLGGWVEALDRLSAYEK